MGGQRTSACQHKHQHTLALASKEQTRQPVYKRPPTRTISQHARAYRWLTAAIYTPRWPPLCQLPWRWILLASNKMSRGHTRVTHHPPHPPTNKHSHSHTQTHSQKCQRPVPSNVSDGERRQMSAVSQNGSQQLCWLKGCGCRLIHPDTQRASVKAADSHSQAHYSPP